MDIMEGFRALDALVMIITRGPGGLEPAEALLQVPSC